VTPNDCRSDSEDHRGVPLFECPLHTPGLDPPLSSGKFVSFHET